MGREPAPQNSQIVTKEGNRRIAQTNPTTRGHAGPALSPSLSMSAVVHSHGFFNDELEQGASRKAFWMKGRQTPVRGIRWEMDSEVDPNGPHLLVPALLCNPLPLSVAGPRGSLLSNRMWEVTCEMRLERTVTSVLLVLLPSWLAWLGGWVREANMARN